MKNLKVNAEKMVELEKTAKTKLMSAVLAIAMAVTPAVSTLAEGSDQPTESYGIVTQKETEAPLMIENVDTFSDFVNGTVKPYLAKFIKMDDETQRQVQSGCKIVNWEFLPESVVNDLDSMGITSHININLVLGKDGKYTKQDKDGWVDTDNWRQLRNHIHDYNQQTIHIDWMNGQKDINHLIDPSIFCYNEHDREIVHRLFVEWFEAYDLTKGTLLGNDHLLEAHEILTELNSPDKEVQLHDVSVGARYLMLGGTGQDMMQFLRDYWTENYKFKELEPYFKADELRESQYVLRDDFEFKNPNCLDELEYGVDLFGQWKHWCLDEVNRDMYDSLGQQKIGAKVRTLKNNA